MRLRRKLQDITQITEPDFDSDEEHKENWRTGRKINSLPVQGFLLSLR